MTKKKTEFVKAMEATRDMDQVDLQKELEHHFLSGPKTCPVPGCAEVRQDWGELFDHFIDGGHKKTYFQHYCDQQGEPFADPRGPGFTQGVKALMVAMFRNPTAVKGSVKKVAQAIVPTEASVALDVLVEAAKAKREGAKTPLPNALKQIELIGDESGVKTLPLPTSKQLVKTVAPEVVVAPEPRKYEKSDFTKVSEHVRESHQINKIWRGQVWDKFVGVFHGFPPCFHCRVNEANQIHHQNPLFHETVLMALKRLGITAEEVVTNSEQLEMVVDEVYDFHMKEGRVLAVPYCRRCNMDAETKRKGGKVE